MKKYEDNKNGIFSLFPGLDKLIGAVADMVENDKDEANITGDIKPEISKKVTGTYGFHVKLGPDKTGSIDSMIFEDKLKKRESPPKPIEPITDIFEEEDKVTVVSELPGVSRDDIELSFDKNTVIISAEKKGARYFKQIQLNFTPDFNFVSETFNNSIYSVTIRKNTQAAT